MSACPWWRTAPLTEIEIELLQTLCAAHAEIASRGTQAVALAAQGSGRYEQAIAAALMTMGDKSGPLEEAYRFLGIAAIGTSKLAEYIGSGYRVPGWGNPIIKSKPDPALEPVAELLSAHWPELYAKLAAVTEALHQNGKRLYPNAAAYSAAVARAVGIPGHAVAYLWVAGRLEAWTTIFNRNKL